MRTAHPTVQRITAAIGVEVAGLDLRSPLADAEVRFLRDAVAEHHVVAVRGQFLSAAQLETLAGSFGELVRSPLQRLTNKPAVSTIEDTAARPPAGFDWHTDISWAAELPSLGFLNAVTIPPYGGDTLWASTAEIYARLSADERMRFELLSAVHAPDESLLASVARHHGTSVAEQMRQEQPPREQPLVRANRQTGRRSLFLSPLYVERIVGPAGADGALLARLNRMLDDPSVQMRWRWRAGDVVIWDETSTCHRALTDHHPQRRVVRRCVVG
ncbi:MAG TPA: TauD/TfdA family dioxygenase [Ilumatobacter sp.]|nr:TauD/TfdA family dioxygenase [Ilumatobacter sp.]